MTDSNNIKRFLFIGMLEESMKNVYPKDHYGIINQCEKILVGTFREWSLDFENLISKVY